MEVVLLEDNPRGGYKIAYEKPYVNCGNLAGNRNLISAINLGMFQLNSEGCHAEISPRETPFRYLSVFQNE